MTLLHTILSSMSVSPVVSTPVSINRLSTNVALGLPLPLCPWTGFQRITLDSGSSGWRVACPASLRRFCLTLRLTLGRSPQSSALETLSSIIKHLFINYPTFPKTKLSEDGTQEFYFDRNGREQMFFIYFTKRACARVVGIIIIKK